MAHVPLYARSLLERRAYCIRGDSPYNSVCGCLAVLAIRPSPFVCFERNSIKVFYFKTGGTGVIASISPQA